MSKEGFVSMTRKAFEFVVVFVGLPGTSSWCRPVLHKYKSVFLDYRYDNAATQCLESFRQRDFCSRFLQRSVSVRSPLSRIEERAKSA